ncbi:MAG TPA: bifunctional glycosyltransferase family 2 protein/CDP-glycerol:glycerophosphate glycerophosphotransferase [Bacillales bacterium]|nr:bifunctional glycosyltransferase family 2 protein/CDP-glycerol:glycerophosphate glycerophosphotransferase [Bacillales bacterium]
MLTPKISVIVPVYNVEDYLEECLDSLVNQTLEGIEVIMVNDGSRDSSPDIMEDYAAKYDNFKAYHKENGGLGQARNFGVQYANGEYLAFLDSDDYVARKAYEKMYETAKETGSDLVIGNVKRFNSTKAYASGLHKKVFRETILKTHISRNLELIYDTTAWNKLFKKSFWDEHQFHFPEGMLYEDLPVTIPAHYLSASTDVISDVVYYWRFRDGEDQSITQKRHELQNFLDRLKAVKMVDAFFEEHHIGGDLKAVKDFKALNLDIKMYLNELYQVDEEYLDRFFKEIQAYLEGVEDESFYKLEAINRIKYYLVKQNEKEKLLKVLYFQKNKGRMRKVVNKGRSLKAKLFKLIRPNRAKKEKGIYGDFPFKDELPKELFRVDQELKAIPRVERVGWKDGQLIIKGFNYIQKINMKKEKDVGLKAFLKNQSTGKQVELPIQITKRRDVTRKRGVRTRPLMRMYNYDWSGYETAIDFENAEIIDLGTGRLELWFELTVDGLTREFRAGGPVSGKRPRPRYKTVSGQHITVQYNNIWELCIDASVLTTVIEEKELQGDTLMLKGWTTLPVNESSIELANREYNLYYDFPLVPDSGHHYEYGSGFQVSIDLNRVEEQPENLKWDGALFSNEERYPLTLSDELERTVYPRDVREARLVSDSLGNFKLQYQRLTPTLSHAEWTQKGLRITVKVLENQFDGFQQTDHLVFSLFNNQNGKEYRVSCQEEITENQERLLTGVIPKTTENEQGLYETGRWEIRLEIEGKNQAGRVKVESTRIRVEKSHQFTKIASSGLKYKPSRSGDGYLDLHVGLSWNWIEDGPRRQKAIGLVLYPLFRLLPMNKKTVVFESYWGRSFSCNPRAIYEYMEQNGMDYKYVWILDNENTPVSGKGQGVRKKSWRYFYYLATAKYFVNNANFPNFYMKRKKAVEIHTLHGTFLKTMGLDIPGENDTERKRRNFLRRCSRWDYLLSPSSYMSRLGRHCFNYEKEILEYGFPRNDVLYKKNKEDAIKAIKKKLGLPLDKKVILYAPTWRTKKSFNFQMDLEEMQKQLGDDYILLLRLHYFVSNSIDVSPFRGFAYNLSAYEDIQELYLVSDLLITDYSSVMFDYANLNRPIFFFTYDLEYYRDQLRGFYIDLEKEAPGPLVKTTEELAQAIQDLKQYDALYGAKLAEFRAAYCEFEKGDASEKVVETVFLNQPVGNRDAEEVLAEKTS